MNSVLEAAVQSALSRDLRIPHPAEIAICADEVSSVTLRSLDLDLVGDADDTGQPRDVTRPADEWWRA